MSIKKPASNQKTKKAASAKSPTKRVKVKAKSPTPRQARQVQSQRPLSGMTGFLGGSKPGPSAKVAKEFLDGYRMKLLSLPAKSTATKKPKGHPGLYLAGVTAQMANDILADELVFMPAPVMPASELHRIERRKSLSRQWTNSAHHQSRASLDD